MRSKVIRITAIFLIITLIMPFFTEVFEAVDVKAYNEKKNENEQPRLLAGEYTAGVIAEDGKLYTWGKSYYPADAYAIDSNIPTVPLQAEQFDTIVSGSMAQGSIGVILPDKTLYTWGWNIWGMCGNGASAEHERECKDILDNVRNVSMGNGITLIVTCDNELYGCGSNIYGELADKIETSTINAPVKIMDNIVAACAGGNTAAAITTEGELYTWGQNYDGKLGNGTIQNSSIPQKLEGLEQVISVSVGMFNMAAVTEDGSLYTWGGVLGSGNGTQQLKPVKIMDDVKSVCMGYENGAAITEDGSLYTWGAGSMGQIGNGKNDTALKPEKIMDNVVEVVWGNRMGMALTEDGNVWTWGQNDSWQLGNGTNENSNVPVNVFNIYSGVCEGKEYGKVYQTVYDFDYDVNTYSQELAETSALYAMLAYDEYRVDSNGQYYVAENGRRKRPLLLEAQLKKDGFTHIESSASYGDNISFNCSYTFANRMVSYKGKEINQILVCIRGTDGVEWDGNMELTGITYNPQFLNTHYNFNIAKKELMANLEKYISMIKKVEHYNGESIILITGHSRGGAVANLAAAELTDMSLEREDIGDVFGYSFATANATKLYSQKPYTNIFNHCFEDDFVPSVPLESWGYGDYGSTLWATADDLYSTNSEFRSKMKIYTNMSDKKRSEADFNSNSTAKLLNHVKEYWKSSYEYYEQREGGVPGETVSLYDFFALCISPAAQEKEVGKRVLIGGGMCTRYSPLWQVFGFFINGQKLNKNINDTHQSYTYYLATKLGCFQFAENSLAYNENSVLYAKASAGETSDKESMEQNTTISENSIAVGEDNILVKSSVSENLIEENSVSENGLFADMEEDNLLSNGTISVEYNTYVNCVRDAKQSVIGTSLSKEEEQQKMIDFINQGENGKSLNWNMNDVDTWEGISFDEEGFISNVDLSYKDLSGTLDLSGFSHLLSLDCSGNNLCSLDLSNCQSLLKAECYFNMALEKLLVDGCGNLEYLDCSGCQIQSLELKDCLAMEELICSNNQLKELHLESLSILYKLLCESNNLEQIQLPEINQLCHVNCEHNYLTSFAQWEALAENQNSRILYQEQNVPEGASFCEGDIAALKNIAATGDNLEKLGWDLSRPESWYGIQWTYDNGFYYAEKISLSSLELEGNIEISNFAKLKEISLSNNKLTSFSMNDCPELVRISCVESELERLEINSCPMLTEIYGYYNYLQEEIVTGVRNNCEKEGSVLELAPQYVKADFKEFAKEDVEAILSFANQEDNKESISFDREKPGCWNYVTWEKQSDGLYHLTDIQFANLWITGSLDMSHMKYLKNFCFEATNITEVILPENIEEIPLKAFYHCVLLKKINIPKTVIKIRDLAFADCTGLSRICFYGKNAQIGRNSFYRSRAIEKVTCYANSTESSYPYEGQPQLAYWQLLADEAQKEENKQPDETEETKENSTKESDTNSNNNTKREILRIGDKKNIGNAVYKITKINSKNKTVTYVECKNKKAKNITIHNTVVIDGIVFKVTAIGKNAFKNMKKLQKVTIGKYVSTIGEKAFCNCKKLKNIRIKSLTLKKIGKYALKGMNKKAIIKVPKSKKNAYKKLLRQKKTGLSKTAKIK